MFIFSSFAIGELSLLKPLKKLLGNLFEVCMDMGPTPESVGSGLPCFFQTIYVLEFLVLMPIVVIYFFTFLIYKLRNK
jgi:hypothetical protein